MLGILCNVLIALAMIWTMGVGVAQFLNSRLDGSAAGRAVGVLIVLAIAITAGYLTVSNLFDG